MPNEMNHAEVANFLDGLADGYEFDSQGIEDYRTEWIKNLHLAAADERRIANGELVPAPVKCGECKKFAKCYIKGVYPFPEFCSYGERKDGEPHA